MISQMGSSDSPGRPGSAPTVRLAGKAVTSTILTYFGPIVTKGSAFAKGSCGPWRTSSGERPALGRLDHIGSSIPTQNRPASLVLANWRRPQGFMMLPDPRGRIPGELANSFPEEM